MKQSIFSAAHTSAAALLFLLSLATLALAGPPLVCHPLTLAMRGRWPWNAPPGNLSGNENYDTRNLVRDTLAILDSGAPVVVRMRRCGGHSLYAKRSAGGERAVHQTSRAHGRRRRIRPGVFRRGISGGNLQPMDARRKGGSNPAAASMVTAWSAKRCPCAERRGDEFAAALMTLQGPEKEHFLHAQRAMAGAKEEHCWHETWPGHFLGNEKQTVAEALTRSAVAEVNVNDFQIMKSLSRILAAGSLTVGLGISAGAQSGVVAPGLVAMSGYFHFGGRSGWQSRRWSPRSLPIDLSRLCRAL